MHRLALIFIGLAFLIPTMVWALSADHSDGPIPSRPDWPEGLLELVNAENRVHGFIVHLEEVFFFEGSTEDFNTFIQQFSKLPNTRLELVLHPGNLEVRSPWDKEPRDLAAAWKLYASPFSPEQLKNYDLEKAPFFARVDVWLGEGLKLSELEISENISVKSSGEIEAFVQKHQEKQQLTDD